MNQIPLVKSDFHETLKGKFAGEYLQIHERDFYILSPSEDMADFLNVIILFFKAYFCDCSSSYFRTKNILCKFQQIAETDYLVL